MKTNTDSLPETLLVIPTYNDIVRLKHFIESFKNNIYKKMEIVVVDDGSTDEESVKIKEMVDSIKTSTDQKKYIRYIKVPINRGKGHAVRVGWNEAKEHHQLLAFCDADGAAPIEEVDRLAKILKEDKISKAVWATRSNTDRIKHRGKIRAGLSILFTLLIDTMFKTGFKDTQCGLKIVKKEEYDKIKNSLEEERFLFDLELILNFSKKNLPTKWVEIKWKDRKNSKVRVATEGINILSSVMNLKCRLNRV